MAGAEPAGSANLRAERHMEIRSIGTYLDYYDSIRARTARVVALIPDASMEWRPAPDRFSFGDLVRHLSAYERWVFAETAAGRPTRYPGHGPELAATPAAVHAYFEQTHAESMAIFRGMTYEDLTRRCVTPAGAAIDIWKWLRAMVEHEVHHRGQIYLMLGLLGVATPPLFGLTSEQVRDAVRLPIPPVPPV
jgi:uncharacterized damage-inducible protein DinB